MVAVPRTQTGYALKVPGAFPKAQQGAGFVIPGSVLTLNGRVKPSMRYLANGASCDTCNVDRSQYLTNLTASGGYLFEASPASARFDFSHPKTIGFRIEVNNTDTGHLLRFGSADPDRLEFSAANTLRVTINNSIVRTYTFGTGSAPTLGAARHRLIIAWVREANPDTTGASNAVQSWLLIWDLDTGVFDRDYFTHAASTTKTQTIVLGANTHPAGTTFSGVITGIWYENRCASATEVGNDWIAAISSPSTILDLEDGRQGLPVLSSAGFGGTSQWHGPMALWCADATRRIYHRLFSPLWNECFRIQSELSQATLDGGTDPWIRGAPGANGSRMHLAWLGMAPVPPTATHVWVRVHLRSYVTGGSPVPIGVRFYSFNRPPGIQGLQGVDDDVEPFVKYHAEEIVTRDDGIGSSSGSYVLKKKLPIARGQTGLHKGWTYLAIGIDVDPNNVSTNDAAARVRVQAVHAVPICCSEGGGGLQFGEGVGG